MRQRRRREEGERFKGQRYMERKTEREREGGKGGVREKER